MPRTEQHLNREHPLPPKARSVFTFVGAFVGAVVVAVSRINRTLVRVVREPGQTVEEKEEVPRGVKKKTGAETVRKEKTSGVAQAKKKTKAGPQRKGTTRKATQAKKKAETKAKDARLRTGETRGRKSGKARTTRKNSPARMTKRRQVKHV